MRGGAPDGVLAQAASWRPMVSAWLGGRLLAADVPVASGRIVAATSQEVPERLTMQVPRTTPGMDWSPGAQADHPLARYGQELQVSIMVGRPVQPEAQWEWETRVGRFLITDWSDGDDGLIEVTGAGRLRRVADAHLTAPTQPGVGATLMSETRRLMPPGVSVAFDPGLVDRACPRSMSWDTDRLAALREIADAWPALLRSDEWGQIRMRAPLPDVPNPVLRLRDGGGGTLVTAARSDTRDGAYNQVVARSSSADHEDVAAVASQAAGPMAVSGPYGPVTRDWASPLLTSVSMAMSSAQTMLANSLLPATSVPVTCAPDPRIDLDDMVEVLRGDDPPVWGWVTGYDLPLTVGDGAMRVDVGVRS